MILTERRSVGLTPDELAGGETEATHDFFVALARVDPDVVAADNGAGITAADLPGPDGGELVGKRVTSSRAGNGVRRASGPQRRERR